jgi:glycosyltransferase involved in cell wall biosynthesis
VKSVHELTIITIGLKNDESLERTYDSLKEIINFGAQWCVVLSNYNGQSNYLKNAELIVGKDSGLYNALNIGIDNVKTEYFMLIHSGDILINPNGFSKALTLLTEQRLDLVLGGAKILERIHLSRMWKPWMFKFLVQPPHLPIIYSKIFVSTIRFDESIPVISDFFMLQKLFECKPNYAHSGEVYISMAPGGHTTSGMKSFFVVSKEFYKHNNRFFGTILLSLLRLIVKIVIR